MITVTLALIFVAKYIFEDDYVRTRSTSSSGVALNNSDVAHLHEDCVCIGDIHRGTSWNGEVPATDSNDGVTIARKALHQIGEGVSALVKSVINDEVCT